MFEQILSSLDGLTDLERADVLRVLMSKDNRLSKVKALLGITTTDQDDVLEFVIQTVEDMILSYINQDTLPPRLENVLIVMCQLLQIGRTGNHDGRRRSCGVCEAWRRPDFLRHRFRFFRIGEHLQPGNRQRRLLRVENCPERISRVKVVILWPSETQALNAPQSN